MFRSCNKCGQPTPSKTRKLCDDCLPPGSKAALSPESRAKLASKHKGKGHKHTKESKAKIAKALKGKERSPDHSQAISKAKKGISTATAETRLKMSKARLGKKFGPLSESAKVNMSRAAKGKKLSPEHRAKISERLKGNTYTKGRKLSDNHKTKLANAHADGRINSPEARARISAKATGRKYSAEFRAKMSIIASERAARGELGHHKHFKHPKYTSKAGQNITFRSSWEYKVAVYLDSLDIHWIYEWDVLELDRDYYLPDFFIFDEARNWIKVIEVKGWFPDKKREIFNKFKQALADLGIELELWDEKRLRELGVL